MIQRENVQTNISLAYHSMGKFDDALAVIRQIKLPQADKQLEFLVHCIYVDCYISKGDLSGAGIWFQRTMDFFNKTKFSRTFSQIINDFISLARAEIGLMYNDLSGFNGTAISYLNTRKNRVAAAEHDLIFAKYAIARLEIQNAVLYLHSVIANGNRLFVVEEAKRLLAEINARGNETASVAQ